jgi:hypothetical protein
MLFKHPANAAKKTQHFSIIKINWSILFKEIIAACSENRKKPINILCEKNAGLLMIKADCTYSYHWAFKA